MTISTSGETWKGTPGNDTRVGTILADTLNGLDGNDTILGGAGNDIIDGGTGLDTANYTGAANGVTVELWRSLATSDGLGGSDTLIYIENVAGSNFSELLAGGTGDDQLRGGAGNDSPYGGAGVDTADYGNATCGVMAALWQQFAINDGQGGTDLLIGIENRNGSSFNDILAGIENLNGANFNDILDGDANNNVLTGWGDNDTMAGVAGADFLIFYPGSGVDAVSDFSRAHLYKLFLQSNLNGSDITAGAQALAAISNVGCSAVDNVGAGNSVTRVGVTAGGLTASDLVIF